MPKNFDLIDSPGPPAQHAMVVFVDHIDCRWLRWLKRGFRHCFVVVRQDSHWVVCDPLKNRIALVLLELPASFDLAGFYVARGHRVLVGRTTYALARDRFALAPLTCVTVAKRLLGVRAPWVHTPRQLFEHLLASAERPRRWHPAPAREPALGWAGQSPTLALDIEQK